MCNTVKLLNKYNDPVRALNFTTDAKRDAIVHNWQKQYPVEILRRCVVVCDKDGTETLRKSILDF